MDEEKKVSVDGSVFTEENGSSEKITADEAVSAKVGTVGDFHIRGEHRVNKLIYFLLSFFFGAMGIHKFYAGRIFAGIVFLAAFCVGFLLTFVFGLGMLIIVPLELIALVQGILVLCKKPGDDGLVEA